LPIAYIETPEENTGNINKNAPLIFMRDTPVLAKTIHRQRWNHKEEAAGFLQCKDVMGVHYDTFPPTKIDHAAAKEKPRSKVIDTTPASDWRLTRLLCTRLPAFWRQTLELLGLALYA